MRSIFISLALTLLFIPPSLAQTGKPITHEEMEKAKARIAEEKYEQKLRQQDLRYKDSIDFMLDDGVMSKEEMKQEAEYIFGLCAANPYQKMYFDCKCLSGAFLLERERLGPTAIQSIIMQTLTQSENAKCANTQNVAGETYKSCIFFSTSFRRLETDHEELCNCAGNRVANQFEKRPWLDPSYVGSLNTSAILHCLDPQNRLLDKTAKESAQKNKLQVLKNLNQ